MAGDTKYIYEPLKSNEIRILELLPSSFPEDRILRGNLLIEDLSDHLPYEALSYTWGEPHFTHNVQLKSGRIDITSNLAAAVSRLRCSNPRRLWIDAICIHQSCDSEKNAQVASMAQIYENCERCVAWLGEGNQETESIMTALNSFALMLDKHCAAFGDYFDEDLDEHGPASGEDLASIADVIAFDWQDYSFCSALGRFLTQGWFRRLWIVQEVALPSRVTLMNGASMLEFNRFATVMDALSVFTKKDGWHRLPLGLSNACDLVAMRRNTRDWRPAFHYSELLELVVLNASKMCQDDRDLIFGLLALQTAQHFHPDYTLDVKDVYQNFVLKHLEWYNLGPLYYAGKFNCRDSTWPSWVPDWKHNEERRLVSFGGFDLEGPVIVPRRLPTIEIEYSAFGIIGIMGKFIDHVESELSTLPFGQADSMDQLLTVPENILKLRNCWKETPYPTTAIEDEAFAKTLLRNDMDFLSVGTSFTILSCYLDAKRGLENGTFGSREHAIAFVRAAKMVGFRRNFFITKSGYIGLGPVPLRPGDAVVVFNGSQVPFILRECDAGDCHVVDLTDLAGDAQPKKWKIIGDCYLHGLMSNEAEKRDSKAEMFWIC